jgi:macrolide-specific efflux system membrane fusion protein
MRMLARCAAATALLITTVLFSGCYLLPKEEETLEVPLLQAKEIVYKTYEAKRSDIIVYVTAQAKFVSASVADCFFEHTGGRLRAVYVKYGQAVKKGDIIAELDTDALENSKTIQYYNLQKARLRLDNLKATGASSYDIKMADYDYKIARANYNTVVEELEKSKLYAPMDGIISYLAKVYPGDTISAYTDLARIIDPLAIRLVIEGDTAKKFKTGMQVEVTIDKEVYEGEVIQCPDDVPPIPADGDTTLRTYIEVAGYESDDKSLGKSATIRFVEDSRTDVIVIPKSLVNDYQGRTYVKVLEDGVKIEVDVEKGLATATEVEIVKGLNEGDKVIIN